MTVDWCTNYGLLRHDTFDITETTINSTKINEINYSNNAAYCSIISVIYYSVYIQSVFRLISGHYF